MSKIHKHPQWNASDPDRWRENNVAQQAQWDEFIKALHSDEVTEIDEEMYLYWLEVLPPIYMGRVVRIKGISRRVNFGFAEGYDNITAFWRDGGRFFCARTEEMNND